jgi:hypothetical protein
MLTVDGRTVGIGEQLRLSRHDRIVKVSQEEAMNSLFAAYSTGCWRNYVAHWAIVDDALYLTSIVGKCRLADEGPLFAAWCNGSLTFPLDAEWQDPWWGRRSYADRERIQIDAGRVVLREALDWLRQD